MCLYAVFVCGWCSLLACRRHQVSSQATRGVRSACDVRCPVSRPREPASRALSRRLTSPSWRHRCQATTTLLGAPVSRATQPITQQRNSATGQSRHFTTMTFRRCGINALSNCQLRYMHRPRHEFIKRQNRDYAIQSIVSWIASHSHW